MEVAHRLREDIELHPFGFRTHTHKLGKVVSGWRVFGGNWTLIGKRDPRKPQVCPLKIRSHSNRSVFQHLIDCILTIIS